MASPREELEYDLTQHRRRFMFVIGSGVSRSTCPAPCGAWTGLLQSGVEHCKNHWAALPPEWVNAQESYLKTVRPDDLILVATAIQNELGRIHPAEYGRWLEETIGKLTPSDASVIRALETWDIQFSTTNYDTLLEQVLLRKPITWREHALAHQFLLGDSSDVLHLHGLWSQPDSVVLGARSYEDIIRDPHTQGLLRSCLMQRTLVFVGCGTGLEDPNFGSLLEWSRSTLAKVHHRHYLLVRTGDLAEIQKQCRCLPIRTVAYGDRYEELAPFLTEVANRVHQSQLEVPDITHLRSAQVEFERQCAELDKERPNLLPGEYLLRLAQLAENLREAGGTRSAWWHLAGDFHRDASALQKVDRVQIGLSIAETMVGDEAHEQAVRILQQLQPDLEGSELSTEILSRYQMLQAQCFNDLCAYSETLDALARAIDGCKETSERDRLEAERAEIRFLKNDTSETN